MEVPRLAVVEMLMTREMLSPPWSLILITLAPTSSLQFRYALFTTQPRQRSLLMCSLSSFELYLLLANPLRPVPVASPCGPCLMTCGLSNVLRVC